MSEYSKYTYTLQEIPAVLTEMRLPALFTDFDYSIVDSTVTDPQGIIHTVFDHEFLEELWFKKYRYREIGAETITRWLNMLYDKWSELCYKYHELFKLFEYDYMQGDVLDNNELDVLRGIIFQDTPQSEIINNLSYATTKTNETTKLKGRTLTKPKYELISEYAKRIRHIYWEWIEDAEPLFMQVF